MDHARVIFPYHKNHVLGHNTVHASSRGLLEAPEINEIGASAAITHCVNLLGASY